MQTECDALWMVQQLYQVMLPTDVGQRMKLLMLLLLCDHWMRRMQLHSRMRRAVPGPEAVAA